MQEHRAIQYEVPISRLLIAMLSSSKY